MNGVAGLSAWAWIFILEGLLSILVSFSAYWFIKDYPQHAPKFLNPAERVEVVRRLQQDSGENFEASKGFQKEYLSEALSDWTIWVHMGIFLAAFCPIYSFSLFSPTIIKDMGYTSNNAQLMSIPPYVCACVFTIGASYFADGVKQRGIFLIGFQSIALVGFALLAGTKNVSVQYGGLVLAAIGIYTQIPLSMAWNSGNIRSSGKRAVGIAMQVMGGNCGGIVASYVYLSSDGPRYIKGHSILIGFIR